MLTGLRPFGYSELLFERCLKGLGEVDAVGLSHCVQPRGDSDSPGYGALVMLLPIREHVDIYERDELAGLSVYGSRRRSGSEKCVWSVRL